jgi:L-amino acid N-acyltransferase YncA
MTLAAIRLATEADIPAINEIYNYYVPRSSFHECQARGVPDLHLLDETPG